MSNVLRREADSFFFRRRVPAPLSARLGQTEIYRSLKTSVRRTARARAAHLFIATEKLFRMLEEEEDEFPLTDDDIRVAVRRWLDGPPWKQRLKIIDEMSPGELRVNHESLPNTLLRMSADEGVSYCDNLGQEANAALEHSEYFDVRSGDRLRRTAAALQDQLREYVDRRMETVFGQENKIDDAAGVIVWLDYTDPNEIQHQIREFQDLIDKLRVGDIVRVTVNAHFSEYADPVPKGQPQPKKTEKQQKTFQKLQSKIGDYLPSDASAADMTPPGLTLLLSRSFGSAVHKAFQPTSANTFKPLSVTRYADGLQMLTMTGAVIKKTEEQALTSALDLKQWPFASKDWSTIHHLVVPALTLRERLFLEREVGGRPGRIGKKLRFFSTADVSIKDFLKSYKDYYRFYPTLLSADV